MERSEQRLQKWLSDYRNENARTVTVRASHISAGFCWRFRRKPWHQSKLDQVDLSWEIRRHFEADFGFANFRFGPGLHDDFLQIEQHRVAPSSKTPTLPRHFDNHKSHLRESFINYSYVFVCKL